MFSFPKLRASSQPRARNHPTNPPIVRVPPKTKTYPFGSWLSRRPWQNPARLGVFRVNELALGAKHLAPAMFFLPSEGRERPMPSRKFVLAHSPSILGRMKLPRLIFFASDMSRVLTMAPPQALDALGSTAQHGMQSGSLPGRACHPCAPPARRRLHRSSARSSGLTSTSVG